MRWSNYIYVSRPSRFAQSSCFILVGSVILLCCSGCTLTWVSRRPDLRTAWLDINSYRRLSLGFERRHLDPPSVQDINEYRWLHGPVSRYSSTVVSKVERIPVGEGLGTDHSGESSVSSEPLRIPIESIQPEGEKVNPPLLRAPASTMPEEGKQRVPVEIEPPSLDSLSEPPERSSNKDSWHPRKSNLEEPTALNYQRPSIRAAIRSASYNSYDSPDGLPGASINNGNRLRTARKF